MWRMQQRTVWLGQGISTRIPPWLPPVPCWAPGGGFKLKRMKPSRLAGSSCFSCIFIIYYPDELRALSFPGSFPSVLKDSSGVPQGPCSFLPSPPALSCCCSSKPNLPCSSSRGFLPLCKPNSQPAMSFACL